MTAATARRHAGRSSPPWAQRVLQVQRVRRARLELPVPPVLLEPTAATARPAPRVRPARRVPPERTGQTAHQAPPERRDPQAQAAATAPPARPVLRDRTAATARRARPAVRSRFSTRSARQRPTRIQATAI